MGTIRGNDWELPIRYCRYWGNQYRLGPEYEHSTGSKAGVNRLVDKSSTGTKLLISHTRNVILTPGENLERYIW